MDQLLKDKYVRDSKVYIGIKMENGTVPDHLIDMFTDKWVKKHGCEQEYIDCHRDAIVFYGYCKAAGDQLKFREAVHRVGHSMPHYTRLMRLFPNYVPYYKLLAV